MSKMRPPILPSSPFRDERCSVTRGFHEFVHLRTFNTHIVNTHPITGVQTHQDVPAMDVFFCRFCLQYVNRPADKQLDANAADPSPNGFQIIEGGVTREALSPPRAGDSPDHPDARN